MGLIFNADKVREPLYCVVPYQNPWRHKSRVKHTQRALKHFHELGLTIIFVESAFNRREFEFEDCGLNGTQTNCDIIDERFKHRHIQIRTESELWLKDNLVNIGVNRGCPEDWQQVAWFDSDIHFARPNLTHEIIQKLQHYKFVQPFSTARDLGPNYDMLPVDYPHAAGVGFAWAWQQGIIKSTPSSIVEADLERIERDLAQLLTDFRQLEVDLGHTYGSIGHHRVFPGLAWACTREGWEDIGGMPDWAIWGGGDWHLSHCLIERTEGMMRGDLHRNYKKLVSQLYQRCRTNVRSNVGIVEGAVFHHWHGKKTSRGYNERHGLLSAYGFDPQRHLKRDSTGVYCLHDDRSTAYVQMRDAFRRIAKERNEDGTDI